MPQCDKEIDQAFGCKIGRHGGGRSCGWITGSRLRSEAPLRAASQPAWAQSPTQCRALTDATDVVECFLGQKIFVAANDDAIGADAMNFEFLDHRIKVLGDGDNGDAADGAANQLIVVEYGNDAVTVGA